MQDYYQAVYTLFQQHGDPATADGQMQYMRNQFDFFGLKMPQWMVLAKQIHLQLGIPKGEDLKTLVLRCFEDEHREMHYFALETLEKSTKKPQPPEWIDFLEGLILNRSWWDTVDWIRKPVGNHFLHHPQLIPIYTDKWIESDNIWLQRMALIFQLKYKQKTDRELLFNTVKRLAHSNEFFVQKGAGWALREYTRIDPESVVEFVKNTVLPPLTRREALKLVKGL
jgi:3-methyladenine DNA glycosylase AlkD